MLLMQAVGSMVSGADQRDHSVSDTRDPDVRAIQLLRHDNPIGAIAKTLAGDGGLPFGDVPIGRADAAVRQVWNATIALSSERLRGPLSEIGRAHVCTPVPNAHLV